MYIVCFCPAGELQSSGPILRPVTIWKISAWTIAVMKYIEFLPLGTYHVKMPFKKYGIITGEGYVSHFTTDRKCFLLFYWAW